MKSQQFIIGNDTITNKEFDYLPNGVGAFSDREYLGTIGNNIWSKYNIIIDTNDGFMYLKRFKPSKEYSESYGYNFRNRTDIGKGWIVSSLEREGAAAIAGLELNDIIITVNGKNVEDYTWSKDATAPQDKSIWNQKILGSKKRHWERFSMSFYQFSGVAYSFITRFISRFS